MPDAWPALPERAAAPTSNVAVEVDVAVRRRTSTRDAARLCAEAYATFDHPAVVPAGAARSDRPLGPGAVPRPDAGVQGRRPAARRPDVRRTCSAAAASGSRSSARRRGDTGSAAIDGVRRTASLDIVIFIRAGRTSDVQRRQMTTVDAPNVHDVAVEGTFDDCQDLVKAMFNDAAFRDAHPARRGELDQLGAGHGADRLLRHGGRSTLGRARCTFAVPDRQLRQRARRLDRAADGRADRRLHRRLEPQRHPRPVRQRR